MDADGAPDVLKKSLGDQLCSIIKNEIDVEVSRKMLPGRGV